MYVYIPAAEIALIEAARPHAPYIYICTDIYTFTFGVLIYVYIPAAVIAFIKAATPYAPLGPVAVS